MTRSTFGGTASDFVVNLGPSGVLHARPATLFFWDAEVDGAPVLDLLLNGSPTDSIQVGIDRPIHVTARSC